MVEIFPRDLFSAKWGLSSIIDEIRTAPHNFLVLNDDHVKSLEKVSGFIRDRVNQMLYPDMGESERLSNLGSSLMEKNLRKLREKKPKVGEGRKKYKLGEKLKSKIGET